MVYRVWVHPRRGDDYAYHFRSLKQAVRFSRKNPRAEKSIYIGGRNLLKEKLVPKKALRRL